MELAQHAAEPASPDEADEADARAHELHGDHEGERKERRPEQSEPVRGSGLRVGRDAGRIVVRRSGNQPRPQAREPPQGARPFAVVSSAQFAHDIYAIFRRERAQQTKVRLGTCFYLYRGWVAPRPQCSPNLVGVVMDKRRNVARGALRGRVSALHADFLALREGDREAPHLQQAAAALAAQARATNVPPERLLVVLKRLTDNLALEHLGFRHRVTLGERFVQWGIASYYQPED